MRGLRWGRPRGLSGRHEPGPPQPPPTTAGDDDADAAFEARIAELKKAKGQMPYGESRKAPVDGGAKKVRTNVTPPKMIRPQTDYDGETLRFESGPHPGDATVNVLLGITLVWIPLTLSALGRAAFVRYRWTDRRLSVTTTAPWRQEQLVGDGGEGETGGGKEDTRKEGWQ